MLRQQRNVTGRPTGELFINVILYLPFKPFLLFYSASALCLILLKSSTPLFFHFPSVYTTLSISTPSITLRLMMTTPVIRPILLSPEIPPSYPTLHYPSSSVSRPPFVKVNSHSRKETSSFLVISGAFLVTSTGLSPSYTVRVTSGTCRRHLVRFPSCSPPLSLFVLTPLTSSSQKYTNKTLQSLSII